MGTTCKPQAIEEDEHEVPMAITRQNFTFLYVIGKGGFGKVWKA
jgi:hypothetical protein